MRRAMKLGLVCSLFAIGACSILGGDFGEYSTEDPADAGPTLPGTDATSGDAPATIDAPNDTAEAGVDSGVPFCMQGTHAFCADFEDPNALLLFTQQDVSPTGLLEISSTRVKGGAKALHTSLPERDTGKIAAVISKYLPGDWRRTVVELDMFIEPIAWQNGDVNASFLEMGYYSVSQSHTFFFVVGPDYTALSGGGTPDNSTAVVETNKWLHVKAELTTTEFAITIDGIRRTHLFDVTQSGDSPRFELGVGIDGFNVPVPKFEVYYDNVAVDFPP